MMNVEEMLMSLQNEDLEVTPLEAMAEDAEFVRSVYRTIKTTMDDEYENYVTMDGVQAMLRTWAENNDGLYALLGNNLKVSKTYMANATYSDFESDFQDFVTGMYNGFHIKKDGVVYMHILTMRNAHHMNDCFGFGSNPVCNLIEYVTLEKNYENVVANRVDGNAYEVKCIVKALDMKRNPDGKKLTKWMHEVLVATVEKLYENNLLNDEEKGWGLKEADVCCQYYSRIIEKIKTTTKKEHTVYVSIDPHDYFRCSYGTDWESCHQVGNMHGDGAIQYCENATTLIAYEEKIDEDDDVNRLKWRQIIYTNDYYSRFVGSRQYRVINNENARVARELVMSCVKKFKNVGEDDWDLVNYTTSDSVQSSIKPYVQTGEYDYAYNDIRLYGGLDDQIWMISRKNVECDVCYVNKNECITCLDCGQRFEGHRDYYFMCENCGGGIYCEVCGCYHDEDDMTYVEDEYGYVCSECLEESFEYCRDCGEWHRRDDMIEYSYNSGEYICSDCIDNYAYCEECECYEYAEKIDEYVDEYGDSHFVCSDCKNNVIYNCDHCGCEYYYTGKFENIACCEECNEALNEAMENEDEE